MKFTLSLSAVAAFAATVMAQTADFNPVFKPESNQDVPAGKTFEITWEAPAKYAAGTVALELIGGADQDHQDAIADIAGGIPNTAGSYAWNVPSDLGDAAVYGIIIRYESDPAIFQYSNPFHITKAEGHADKPKGDVTTTISKDYGIKTVTLSSCDCEETTSTVTPPAPTATITAETTPTPTPTSKTTTVKKPSTIVTKPATPIETESEEPEVVDTTPEPSTVPEEGAGARFGASSVALVGAFVVAALSL